MQLLTDRTMIGAAILCLAALATSPAVAQIRGQPPPPIDPNPIPICFPQTGGGTAHNNSVNAGSVERWDMAGGPHQVMADISVSGVLTIERCTVVRIAAGKSITVYPGGTLQIAGSNIGPVLITKQINGNAWGSIRNFGGTLSLTYANLTDGGATTNTNLAGTAMLEMKSNNASGRFHVDNVGIGGSASQGVLVSGPVGFDASSANLDIRNSAYYPLQVQAHLIGSIPGGNYSENKMAAIAIPVVGGGGSVMTTSQTMRNRGVPYHVGNSSQNLGRLDVQSPMPGTVAVLTIEPGVVMQFSPGGSLKVDPIGGSNTAAARGALIAIGTQKEPIIFTSDKGAAAAAGDWVGITFGGAISPQTALQLVRVEYAGGAEIGGNSCPVNGRGQGENYAAIRIYGPPLSNSPFLTDSVIFASARDGIDRGWNANVMPDFKAVNSFAAVPGCWQSTPKNPLTLCPTSVTCP